MERVEIFKIDSEAHHNFSPAKAGFTLGTLDHL
jgi:hypothetical protein